MLEPVTNFSELATHQYEFFKKILTGITTEELEWKIHPEANAIRWIVGHLRWFEDWVPDAIENKGRYGQDKAPLAYDFEDLNELLNEFDNAKDRRINVYESLTEDDLQRKIDYFGAYDVTVKVLTRVHAGHMSGHTYQVRFIRGTYSRANKTDKSVFDPW
jgi:hypothetical protein